MGAEAVIFFDPARGAHMPDRRKRGGALASKHRFIAAQIEGFLEGDLWLKLARHANAMADALGSGLASAGCKPVWPVEANEVFAKLPAALDRKLKAAGAAYYPWQSESMPADLNVGPGETVVRLVTSFQTTEEDVDKFLAIVRAK
jgi:threonine aldolase